MTDPAERLPTTEAGRTLLATLRRELGNRTAQAAKVDILAIEAKARAAGREEERERNKIAVRDRLTAYAQAEPDPKISEGIRMARAEAWAILDAPAEDELTRALERAWREIVRSFGGR